MKRKRKERKRDKKKLGEKTIETKKNLVCVINHGK